MTVCISIEGAPNEIAELFSGLKEGKGKEEFKPDWSILYPSTTFDTEPYCREMYTESVKIGD